MVLAVRLYRPPSYAATEAWLERRGRRKRKAAGAPTDVDWDMDPNTGKLLPVAAPGSYTQVRKPSSLDVGLGSGAGSKLLP